MKFTFWCYAPALLLITIGLLIDWQAGNPPAPKYHLGRKAGHVALLQNRPEPPGTPLEAVGVLMLFPATALVCIYWAGRAWRRASRDSEKGRNP